MDNDRTVDVLVVGAGPTGTALAIDLARRGLDIRVIDRDPRAFEGSRAKGVQPRTLEVLDDLGAVDDVLAGGGEYPKLGVHAFRWVIPWRMFPHREPTAAVPYPNTWLVPQFRTDRALHARLESLGHHVELGAELVSLSQDADTATARLASGEEITARYLVGADGGASTVRHELDIGFLGSTDEVERVLLLDAVTEGLSRDRWHVWARIKAGACPLPGTDLFQWMFQLKPDEEPPASEDEINQRLRPYDVTVHDIRWQSLFRPNIRLADAFRRGRAFIAGDAGHVHTPAGAQGLNTGIQDGYNLGWKLAQVLAGADEALLDTYEAERLPIAASVIGLSTKKYEGIAKLDPSSIKRGKEVQQLALTYRGGPLAPTDADHTATLHTGDRAPDAELRDADGTPVRLFDAFRGTHFTAIAHGPTAAEALARLDWPTAGAELKRITTGEAPEFAHAYGLTADTLLLIRPDGYVGHIATHDMLDTTRAATQTMTPKVGT
ncbi:FAD-dependent oxidoreductase [Actinophytocola sp.]|uniref:FAD-dependent oxidoreductase n=1 Tax=Actinophytocola sp. TaxID=1872138 RepID=UPI003899B25F